MYESNAQRSLQYQVLNKYVLNAHCQGEIKEQRRPLGLNIKKKNDHYNNY